MFKLLFFMVASAGVRANNSHNIKGSQRRIYHGYEAAIQSYPHAVFLHFRGTRPSSCGSSLVSEQAVVTAAHCVDELRYGRGSIDAYLGSVIPKHARVLRPVLDYRVHPKYLETTGRHNIAVAFFNRRVTLSPSIQKIPLATTNPAADSIVYSVGWGKQTVNNFKLPDLPGFRSMRVSMQRAVSRSICSNYSDIRITPTLLCTVPVMGHMHMDDSGDGLVQKSGGVRLMGVLSYVARGVNVYTGILNTRRWITRVLRSLCLEHCTDSHKLQRRAGAEVRRLAADGHAVIRDVRRQRLHRRLQHQILQRSRPGALH
ncbi:hypothetical protein evm_012326 [Chilo suppressalis]|nr:hypothetical protein evm_012326 [Chilo suppressalis]